MSMKALPRPSRMYIGRSEQGSKIEGRENNHAGNTMKPGALTHYHKIENLTLTTKQEEWSRELLTQYEYDVVIRSFIPHSVIFDVDSIADGQIKRLETLSFWHASFQEIKRHLGLIEKAKEHPWWKDLIGIVESFKEEIKDAFIAYVHGIEKNGDYSIEQFTKYAKRHEASASPWQGYKWSDIVKRDNLLKHGFAECTRWIKDLISDLPKIFKFDRPLIRAQFTYPALRARPANYEIVECNNERIMAHCTKTRDRKAGGVAGLSQIEWPIFDLTANKRAVYRDSFDKLFTKISGCEGRNIEQLGAVFYKEVIDQEKLHCYDLRNAEKFVGILLGNLPFVVDLGHPHYPADIAGELYSGVGPTPPGSWTIVGVMLRKLKDEGYEGIDKVWGKADNFAFNKEINTVEEEIDIFFTNEKTVLGLDPERKCFWPYSASTDNVKNRANIPREWRMLTWIQRFQFDLRPAQVLVNNSILTRDACKNLIEWVVQEDILKDADIYNKETINEKISSDEKLEQTFRDKFTREIEYVHQFFPYHSDPDRKSTDAHLTVIK